MLRRIASVVYQLSHSFISTRLTQTNNNLALIELLYSRKLLKVAVFTQSQYDAMELPGQQLSASLSRTPLDYALNLDVKLPACCQRMTGIIATIGKSSKDVQTMQKMMAAGMSIALLNLSFGTQEEHIEMIQNLRQAAKEYSITMGKYFPLAIAVRLPGRKIRTGYIDPLVRDETVPLNADDTVCVTIDETYKELCSSKIVYLDFKHLAEQLNKGDIILLDNETIQLKVDNKLHKKLICKIERGGLLGSNKDVFIPNVFLNMTSYSERDKEFVDMAVQYQLDIIIASFINTGESIVELRNALGVKGKHIAIVSNIQTIHGYNNFDDILKVTNGIMISRQELGSDISPKKLVLAQKSMIARANKANVPICLGPQLLSSMRYNKMPMRSELLDVANCVLDGADALVLSVETAVGITPVEAICYLAKACRETEACVWTKRSFNEFVDDSPIPCDELRVIAMSAVLTAYQLIAAAIIVVTSDGKPAFEVARYKPRCPIVAVTRYPSVARKMHLYRGIMPLIYEATPHADWETDLNHRLNFCARWAMQRGFVRVGDPLVMIYGWKRSIPDVMRIVYATADIEVT